MVKESKKRNRHEVEETYIVLFSSYGTSYCVTYDKKIKKNGSLW